MDLEKLKEFKINDSSMESIKGGKSVIDTCPTSGESGDGRRVVDVVNLYEDGSWDTDYAYLDD